MIWQLWGTHDSSFAAPIVRNFVVDTSIQGDASLC